MTARRLDGLVWVPLLLGMVAFAGCAQVSFKRGASPDQMATSEQECRRSTTDDAAYTECMRQRGWFVLGAKDGSATGVPATPVSTPSAPAGLPGSPVPAGASGDGPTPAPPVITPAAVEPIATPEPIAAEPTPIDRAPEPSPPAATPESDPLSRIDVGSWWKLGGTAAGLQTAAESCTVKLGAAHRPEAELRVVTVAMRDCLRAAGWYPLGGAARK